MKYPYLFSPFTLCGLTIPNRTVMPPMSTQLGSEEGLVTPRQMAFYGARAAGGTGMIIVEFCCVHRASGQSEPNQLALETPAHVAGHRDLVSVIRAAGSVACLQLQHGGHGAKRKLLTIDVPVGASDVRSRKDPSKLTGRGLTDAEIEHLIECFGRSAELGMEAGYQAVELHGAHGYLLTQFLSPMTNHRDDAWGGDEERRLNFPRRVIERVKRAIGDRPLLYRLSADEFAPNGLNIVDMERISPKLVAAGADALHVSIGVGSTSFDKILEPMSMPEGWRLPYARRIRQATGVPVIAVGQIRRPITAEKALADGDADLIALGRTLLADPEWANKARAGRDSDIVPCTSCNFCVSNGFQDKSIACADNPRTGRELEPLPDAGVRRGERAVVVGGGPGGMAAALWLDRSGYRTELYEARRMLGGGLIASAAPPFKDKIDWYRAYLERQLSLSDVQVRLDTCADMEQLTAHQTAIVVLATGARTVMPPVEGLDNPMVRDAYELLMGEGTLPPPGNVPAFVYGGGETGCEMAEYLAERDYEVVLVSRSPAAQLARSAEMIYRGALLKRLRENSRIRIIDSTTLLRIANGAVALQGSDGKISTLPAGCVVIAQGRSSDTALADALRGRGIRCATIGDARRGGRIGDAVRDAYDAVVRCTDTLQ